jgi:hypothetical protein
MPADRQVRRREPQLRGRPSQLRRRAWKPVMERRRRSSLQRDEAQRNEPQHRDETTADVESVKSVFLDHEYFPPKRPVLVRALLRTVGLASDITLLVLLSPFFAAWFLYRAARAMLSRSQ